MLYVPVVDYDQTPLMPTTPSRARRWVKENKATPFFKGGVFCVRLNKEPSGRTLQPIAVGIDPGSKREGLTVKSEAHTYLNILATAVTWVKDSMKTRRAMRKGRRFRGSPCRKNKTNRSMGVLAPSVKSRWQWKLRLCRWLKKMFCISAFVVENVKAISIGVKRWDVNFSAVEMGKNWFYGELSREGRVILVPAVTTKALRSEFGLKKSHNKGSRSFSAHCVDSWVLANFYVGGHDKPEHRDTLIVVPLHIYRRRLHYLQPSSGGSRSAYGGSMSLGFKRGSIVKHKTKGLSFIGGTSNGRISLHRISSGKRFCQNARPEDVRFLAYNSWRTEFAPGTRQRIIR